MAERSGRRSSLSSNVSELSDDPRTLMGSTSKDAGVKVLRYSFLHFACMNATFVDCDIFII